jgi:cysteate synthase
MSHFNIVCRKCGTTLKDTYCAFCEHCKDSLLVTEYKDRYFREAGDNGIWRFNWLPVHEPKGYEAGPVVFRSRGLGKRLGLDNLYISFSGYWPDIGAGIETCTFKEFEAAVVLENAWENGINGLVVASAGNTARAFAHLSTLTGYPVIIVVPKMCLSEMWYLESSTPVPTVTIYDGDYADAIDVASRIAQSADMPFEGGVKNIAKRDGLGIVLMEAVSSTGRLPDHYFQAVGSGAGAIAVWEMANRFLKDGRFGGSLPHLHLAQNLPFAPMFFAWRRGERNLSPQDLDPGLITQISTRVLSNRYPAYSVGGGVYDALSATNGNMYGVTNEEMQAAKMLFEEEEGMDIVPAAAVALGALMQSAQSGEIRADELVLLNITGGGEDLIRSEGKAYEVKGEFTSKDMTDEKMEELLCLILKKSC